MRDSNWTVRNNNFSQTRNSNSLHQQGELDSIKMAAVNLYNWIPESLPETQWSGAFDKHGNATWSVRSMDAVFLTAEPGQNSDPSTFCSDIPNAVGNYMKGKVRVPDIPGRFNKYDGPTDDDYFGWTVGYVPDLDKTKIGDFENPEAIYYLLDWKRGAQGPLPVEYNPCGGTEMTVPAGLTASKVTGMPAESEFWSHTDYICGGDAANDPGTVTQLVPSKTGTKYDTGYGWEVKMEYPFCLSVTEDKTIKLAIDGMDEIVIENAELDKDTARFCFYTFSQDDPEFYDIEVKKLTSHGCDGDPHFRTWTEEHFEYHGQCDLLLTKDPDFADGLGIDVHIRTKLVRYWSYIKTAVIRIGNDILEIEGSAIEHDAETHYWINYEYQGELTEFGGFPVKFFSQEGTAVTKNRIEIDLGSKYPGQKIVLSTFKEFVKVKFINSSEESYGKTVGMLGDYKTGKTLGRDGVTEIHDFTQYGHEWQVLPTDGKFFREAAKPQFPEPCIEPEDPRGQRKRRLAESGISIEDAEAACAGVKDALDRKDCVYDIIATQDMDMVGAY